MREILSPAARWVREGRAFAIATVVGTSGSAPRPVGSSMIVSAAGVFGNVSGGASRAPSTSALWRRSRPATPRSRPSATATARASRSA
ncbi:XdhC family protein [Microbacterium hominis]|uniref:XdhC family protein n=1 Tax=Microbacterium hominis TaxID=162426 RepID=UPI001CC2741C